MNTPGVLLVNLGSPDSPAVPDVRRYLREFLMDKRVLDAPWPIRFCVVNFAILPSRPKQSAHAYQSIWTAEGSPLIVSGKRVQAELQKRLGMPVELAMRYQNPSIESGIRNLRAKNVDAIVCVVLFPHYAMSSYETAEMRVRDVMRKIAPETALHVVPPFYDDPDYITALVASAADYLKRSHDHLLFSFHGVPERHLHKSDPTGRHCLKVNDCCATPGPPLATCYRAQCFRTVEAFVKQSGVTKYSVAFQSRLGKDPWLRPYTDVEIERLAKEGVKKLLVICPAFVADCLETLEEIGMRGRDTFLAAGGTEYTLIPCLNEHPLWLTALEKMVRRAGRPSDSLTSVNAQQPAGVAQ